MACSVFRFPWRRLINHLNQINTDASLYGTVVGDESGQCASGHKLMPPPHLAQKDINQNLGSVYDNAGSVQELLVCNNTA